MTQLKPSHRAYLLAILIVFILLIVTGFQSRAPKQDVRGVEKTNSQMVTYSPTDLGMNNIVLPASTDTTYSTVINTSGVRAMTFSFTCSQTVDLRAQFYAEDGATVLNIGGNAVRTGMAATQYVNFYIGTEVDTNGANGAAGTALRFPQRALSFAFRNTTATPGTCTARAFAYYD